MNEFQLEDFDDTLAHFGVKGMHWGVERHAHADANEYTKAKLFYGEGAGNRRKLIKAKVEARSKKSPEYKAAFEKHVANQNLDKRASQAIRTRNRKDATKTVGKTARGVHRSLSGGFGSVSLASAVIAGAYVTAHKTGADKVVVQKAKDLVNNKAARDATIKWLRSQGVDAR